MKPLAYYIMRESEDIYWWYRARRDIICQLVLREVPAAHEIIDYGCGGGATSVRLRNLGYTVLAADISSEALEMCQLRGLAIRDLKKFTVDECSADCILAGDVLEHIKDEVGLLKTFHRTLRPRGTLIATVPAYEFLWSGEDYVSEHLRRYTRKRLTRTLRSAGFENIWCSYYNTFLFPVVLLVTLGKRLFFPREMYRSNIKPLSEWQNELLYKVFAFERHFLSHMRFPLGASLICVARKV